MAFRYFAEPSLSVRSICSCACSTFRSSDSSVAVSTRFTIALSVAGEAFSASSRLSVTRSRSSASTVSSPLTSVREFTISAPALSYCGCDEGSVCNIYIPVLINIPRCILRYSNIYVYWRILLRQRIQRTRV